MKKIFMTYDELEGHCASLAEMAREYNPTEVIAVARKGMIPAFLIGNILNLKVGLWYPVENMLLSFKQDRLLFVDDKVALGRTCLRLNECFPDTDYRLASIFVDADCPHRPDYYSFVATDWVIFPFMKDAGEVPGVRHAFRDSEQYSK